VSGHAGTLVLAQVGKLSCAVLKGRIHYYEGHSAEEIVFPIRTLIKLGASSVVVTNAAGGLTHPAGTLMLIRDHINLIPDNPLRGSNDDAVGPRFPDMTHAYDPGLREVAQAGARDAGVDLAEGVYMACPGPSYETPAEISMYRGLGADAVGMSTAPEVIAANHMGAQCLGISCITNAAAGMTGEPLSHDEVTQMGQTVRPRFEKLLRGILTQLSLREANR
jgi:purine-nucleoside phosphorylase